MIPEIIDVAKKKEIDKKDIYDLIYNFAYYLYKQKSYHLIGDYFDEALQIARDSDLGYSTYWNRRIANSLIMMGLLHDDLTRYTEAEEEYKEALKIRRELAAVNPDAYIGDVAMTLENIARLFEATDRKAEAKDFAEEALEIYKPLAKRYPQIWNSYVDMVQELLNDINAD